MTNNKVKIKICGIKESEAAELVEALGSDFIGFVCYEHSPRNISLEEYKLISDHLKTDIQKVVVTVNPSDDFIEAMLRIKRPDYLQIHGTIDLARLHYIKSHYGLNIIAAISHENLEQSLITKLETISDFMLIDSVGKSSGTEYGGSGVSFNWHKLKEFNFTKPYFLSGGLSISNLKEAIDLTKATHIDLSSGVEEVKGVKSKRKIVELFNYLQGNGII